MINVRDISYKNKKAPRYLKQRNNYSCGVILMLNILKNLGYNYTYRDYKVFEKWIHCSKNGTPYENIWSSLYSIKDYYKGIKYIKYYSPLTLKIIDKALKEKSIIAINYHFTKNIGKHSHVFLLTRATKKMYECINVDGERTISLVSRKAMNKALRMKRNGYPSDGWIIQKEK